MNDKICANTEKLTQSNQNLKLGEQIKTARKNAGLSQRELGDQLGLSSQTIACWENGSRKPKQRNLRQVADALDVTIGYLLCSGDENSKDIDTSLSLLSDNLRYLRREIGWTQRDLSEKTGISLRVIKDYENSSSGVFITNEHLTIISEVLGVESDKVLGQSVTNEWMEAVHIKNCKEKVYTALEKLNIFGLQKAAERISEIAELPRYKKKATQEDGADG